MAFSGSGSGRFQIRRLVNGETGAPGAAFIRVSRTGAKPDGVTPDPTAAEVNTAIDRDPVLGDIVIITYELVNASGEFSCGFELTAIDLDTDPITYTWEVAAEFIDGNLVVAGSVFSNVGISAGISVSALENILEWSSAIDETPALAENQNFAGAYLGFVENPTTGSTVTQEILLVGDQDNHILFDGVNLTLSGVVIEDPQIFVTPPTVEDEVQNANIPAWNAGTTYNLGDVVTFNDVTDSPDAGTQIYQAQGTSTNVIPSVGGTVNPAWLNITSQVTEVVTQVPSVFVSENAPLSATEGDLWYDESIGRAFVYLIQDDTTDPPVGTWADITKN